MGDRSGIVWTDATWNPTIGCRRVSDGCRRCYAERQARRIVAMGGPTGDAYRHLLRACKDCNGTSWLPGDRGRCQECAGTGRLPAWNGTAKFLRERLDQPLRWKRPRRIFVDSMSDLFHDNIADEQIAAVWGVMAACPQHTFQVLTKRPDRMLAWFDWQREETMGWWGVAPWPLPNVWLGVSVEDWTTAETRIPDLLRCPAAVRWVSYEPALGPVNFAPWLKCDKALGVEALGVEALDWIVVGGESGPDARVCDAEWIRDTIQACGSGSGRSLVG